MRSLYKNAERPTLPEPIEQAYKTRDEEWADYWRTLALAVLGLMLAGLFSCQPSKYAPKVKAQHHNAKPKALGWAQREALNEQAR